MTVGLDLPSHAPLLRGREMDIRFLTRASRLTCLPVAPEIGLELAGLRVGVDGYAREL